MFVTDIRRGMTRASSRPIDVYFNCERFRPLLRGFASKREASEEKKTVSNIKPVLKSCDPADNLEL